MSSNTQPNIDRLCHYVGLQKSGLTDEVYEQLVLSVLASSSKPLDRHQLLEGLIEIAPQLPKTLLESIITRLIDQKSVSEDAQGRVHINDQMRRILVERLSKYQELMATVKEQWSHKLYDQVGDIDSSDLNSLWSVLTLQLGVLVFRHGASTAALIKDDPNLLKIVEPDLRKALLQGDSLATAEYGQDVLEASLATFLGLGTIECDQLLSWWLSSAFSYYALSIDDETREFLKTKLSPLEIFLDTNFIFGILELHDSPWNQLCQELVKIIKQNKLPIKFYFLDDTLSELRDWIEAQTNRYLSGTYQPSLSRAIAAQVDLPLFVRRFHEENSREKLDPDVYIARFRNPVSKLREVGFEIYRQAEQDEEDLTTRSVREAEYKYFLNSRPLRKPRSDDAIKHDSILIGVVDRRRKPADNPLMVGAFILTVDSHLSAFCRNKSYQRHEPTMAIYPGQLLQLLMPFIDLTNGYERSLSRAIALPTFNAIDFDRERAKMQIANYLRGVKDLSDNEATTMLSNEILVARVSSAGNDIDAQQIIENTIFDETRTLRDEINRLEQERHISQGQVANEKDNSRDLQQRIDQLDAKIKSDNEISAQYVGAMAQRLETLEDRAKIDTENIEMAWGYVKGLVLGTIVAFLTWFLPIEEVPWLAEHSNILGIHVTLFAGVVLGFLATFVQRHRLLWLGFLGADLLFSLIQFLVSKETPLR